MHVYGVEIRQRGRDNELDSIIEETSVRHFCACSDAQARGRVRDLLKESTMIDLKTNTRYPAEVVAFWKMVPKNIPLEEDAALG